MKANHITPIKAIRRKCIDCCCGQLAVVRLCESTNCSLYPFRLGKRPTTVARMPVNGQKRERGGGSALMGQTLSYA